MLLHILIVKIIAGDFPAIQIVFIRCLASSIILLPLFITQKRLSEMNQDLGLNALRVGFTTLAITINFFTISQIQLAQVSTIGYLRPAVVSVIAWCFLGEQQSWYRWGVIAASFAGSDSRTYSSARRRPSVKWATLSGRVSMNVRLA